LAAVLGESVETVECGIEPHLVGQGLVERTGRGRVATEKARGLYGRREVVP
jgi:Holliday junction resolvasome RuvABC ATP-dependent DNA helicase subunit